MSNKTIQMDNPEGLFGWKERKEGWEVKKLVCLIGTKNKKVECVQLEENKGEGKEVHVKNGTIILFSLVKAESSFLSFLFISFY